MRGEFEPPSENTASNNLKVAVSMIPTNPQSNTYSFLEGAHSQPWKEPVMLDQTSPFMTLKEAAAFLRYSPSTLYQRQDIPRTKLPGSKDWRYEKQALLAWVASAAPPRLKPQPEPAQPSASNSPEPRTVPRRRSSRYR